MIKNKAIFLMVLLSFRLQASDMLFAPYIVGTGVVTTGVVLSAYVQRSNVKLLEQADASLALVTVSDHSPVTDELQEFRLRLAQISLPVQMPDKFDVKTHQKLIDRLSQNEKNIAQARLYVAFRSSCGFTMMQAKLKEVEILQSLSCDAKKYFDESHLLKKWCAIQSDYEGIPTAALGFGSIGHLLEDQQQEIATWIKAGCQKNKAELSLIAYIAKAAQDTKFIDATTSVFSYPESLSYDIKKSIKVLNKTISGATTLLELERLKKDGGSLGVEV